MKIRNVLLFIVTMLILLVSAGNIFGQVNNTDSSFIDTSQKT